MLLCNRRGAGRHRVCSFIALVGVYRGGGGGGGLLLSVTVEGGYGGLGIRGFVFARVFVSFVSLRNKTG